MSDHILQQIERLTRDRFPAYAQERLFPEALEKGGSDRVFYRLRTENLEPLIFVQYSSQKEENRHYVEIAQFLSRAQVRVPKMYLHEPDEGRIWMEDLGELDLWSFRNDSWDVRKPLYEASLRELHRLHCSARHFATEAGSLILQPPFRTELYQWEQDYFFKHCVARHFGIPLSAVESARVQLKAIALELDALPRVFVHRDFQSQNIVVRGKEACLIDFQGMRFGLPQYDLASLLLDPYTSLTDTERESLLRFYCSLGAIAGEDYPGDFDRIYDLCAAQRLMQALGAYGFLGYEKGKSNFLAHIPVALPRLIFVLERISGFEELTKTLRLKLQT